MLLANCVVAYAQSFAQRISIRFAHSSLAPSISSKTKTLASAEHLIKLSQPELVFSRQIVALYPL